MSESLSSIDPEEYKPTPEESMQIMRAIRNSWCVKSLAMGLNGDYAMDAEQRLYESSYCGKGPISCFNDICHAIVKVQDIPELATTSRIPQHCAVYIESIDAFDDEATQTILGIE